MKDVNWPLRKIYYSALNGLTYNSTTIKAFYQKAPDDISDKYYIVFAGLTNNDVSSKQKSDTDTSIRVTIHTYESKYNDGRAADAIAQLVFDAIYPNKQTRPDMSADGLQVVNTSLSQDLVQDYNIQNSREYFDRILTFTHRVYHS